MKKQALFVLFSLFLGVAFSQTQPLSLTTNVPKSKTTIDKNTAVLNPPAPNVAALLAEDELAAKNGEIFRIGVALNVNEDLIHFGNWEVLPNGDRKLLVVVKSEGAEALSFEFDNFHLPVGATMRAFNTGKWHYSKLFTSLDNRTDNGFFLPMVYGDEIIIEIIEPSNAYGQTIANLENVFYNYRETGNPMIEKINESDPCQVNVNCAPEGDFWQDEKGGVARIYAVDGGSAGLCTGSLVNNTAQDCKPYFLTALHCGDGTSAGDMNNWVFYFEYEAPGCTNPTGTGSLLDNYVQSCFRVADSNDGGGASGSDFLLVQLGTAANEAVTVNTLKSYNAYWSGWDVNNTTSNEGVGIHHPSGDIKKISTYTSNLVSTSWGGTPGTHWRVVWSGTSNGHGVTEGGSSGSPIFRYTGSGSNEDSKIIGTLTGGSSFCTATGNPDQYGKMSYHWNSNGGNNNEQLEPWLDPIGSGVSIMNGSADPCSTPAVPVADFMANQTSVLEGTTVEFTDLTSGVPDTWTWTISPGTNGAEWEYVGGTSSTDQNPDVQFNTPGFYTVELTASNAQGSDTETKVDYIEVIEIVCGEPISAAYTMGFETGEDLTQWVVINANGDVNTGGNANTWGLYDFSGAPQGAHGGNNVAGYFYNNDGTTPGDDWLITGCLDLAAGANYTMSYWWSTGDGYDETMEVFVGTDQTVAGMTQSIQNLGTVQNNNWTEEIINFTVPASGEYYIGFHCTSAADQWYIAIDDINLTGVATGVTITNAPANVTIECDESTDPSNTGDLTAITDCNPATVTINYTDVTTAGTCANEYTIERTWEATDNCGNIETHVQTITVVDNTAPVVSCGVTTDLITTSGGSATLPNYVTGSTISDNCTANGDLVITQNPSAGTSMTAGTYTVDITAEDECGNIGSCSITVTVENNEEITITNTPGNLTIECDESTDPSNTGEATATTSCATGGLTINYTDNVTAGACVNAQVIERTWVITDNCGNNETFVQTITVDDNTSPIVVCGQTTDELNTTTTIPLPDYTSGSSFNDNCTANGDLIISQSPAAGTSMSPGNYTVVISAEDECGNIGTCEVAVTVINDDGITITISPNDVTIDCDESTDPSNTGALTAQTTCATGGLTVNYTDVSDNQSCPETITRTWTVIDDCGASETYEQIITIDDLTAPTADPISSMNFECEGDIPAPNTALVTGVSDNCTASPSVYFISDVSNGLSCPETITRTYGVEDDCGNVTEITQDFIIEDVTDPTADPLNPLAVECFADVPTPNTTIVTGVSDNCAATPSVTFVGDVSDGQACPETITRTYEVSDDCGNSIFIDQTIVINDVTAPVVTPLSDISVQCSADVPSPNTGVVNASDNCIANPIVTHLSDVSDGNSCPETITRTYRVADNCGNFTEVTQSIVVNDDTAPVISCGVTNETILASQGSTVPDYSVSTTATDNCTSNPTITQSPAVGSALSLGSNIITMTATDDCGNESTCTIDVLYEDDASLDENELSSVSFYPNPTTNILNIDFGTEMNDATIVLYDANGKLIVEKKVQNKESETIDLSIFAKGMYTVIVHSKNGTTTQKVSKM